MINFFKRLRKGHLSKGPIATLLPIGPCGKASVIQETSKQCLMEKDDDGTKISDDGGFSQVSFASSNPEGEPVMTRHLEEPCEVDHPIRCPHPETCIIQDGRALKERLPRVKRRGQLPFLTKSEVQRLRWSCHSAPSDYQTYRAAAAPNLSSSLSIHEPALSQPITP